MGTTIQVSKELVDKLRKMKIHVKESYEDIIWDLIEDRMELSDETKRSLVEYEKDLRENGLKNMSKWEDVKKELNLDV